MDMEKLTEKLLNSKDLKDIPSEYIFRVAFFILDLINKGDVFYDSTTATDITG